MRRLRDLHRNEDGVSLVLIGVALIALIAFVGFAVDAGAMYQERRELRRGADAAALAIAEDCATGAKACNETVGFATADVFADANVDDGIAGVESVVIDTAPANPDYTMTVKVDTLAEDAEGPGFAMRFMQLLGIDRVDVHGSATAATGYPAEGSGFPITIEECEYYKSFTEPDIGTRVVLRFHQGNVADEYDDGTADPCAPDPAGKDAPGAFGYLFPVDHLECSTLITCEGGVCTVFGEPGGGSGSPPTPACDADEVFDLLIGEDVNIPIYSNVTGAGSNALYTIAGFGAFHVDAYNLGGPKYRYDSGEWLDPGGKCPDDPDSPEPDPSDACLIGYFTDGGVMNEGGFGGQNFGTTLIRLID
jgi:hypothetical protein